MARHYFDQAVLESAVGGARRLKELLKGQAQAVGGQVQVQAVASPAAIDSVLTSADGLIRTNIGRNFDLDSFDALWFNEAIGDAPKPTRAMSDMDRSSITTFGKYVLAYAAWTEGGESMADAPTVAENMKKAEAGLQTIGARLLALGSKPQPASSRHYGNAQPRNPGKPPAGSGRAAFRGFT